LNPTLNFSFIGCIAVGVGAAIGAWLRWGMTLWLNDRHPHFPLGTFTANAVGGFLVGLAVVYFAQHVELPAGWRLFIITGFLGGLTTFSTYSAEVVELFSRGELAWAVGVGSAHLLASLLLTAAGIAVARAVL